MSNKNLRNIHAMSIKLFLSTAIILIIFGLLYVLFYKSETTNITKSKNIWWSQEWSLGENVNSTIYPGSEFKFNALNAQSISIQAITEDQLDEIMITLFINGKEYTLGNPYINSKKLEIFLEKTDEPQLIHGMFYCRGVNTSCRITIQKIVLQGGKLLPYTQGKQRSLGVLGDSISLMYGSGNYASILARELGYHLYNQSVWSSTVSKKNGTNAAVLRFEKIIPYKPDIIILQAGRNDAANKNIQLDDFAADYEKIVKQLRAKLPDSKIIMLGLISGLNNSTDPARYYEFNNVMRGIAEHYNLDFIDLADTLTYMDYDDDVHPDNAGQHKLSKYVLQYIREKNL